MRIAVIAAMISAMQFPVILLHPGRLTEWNESLRSGEYFESFDLGVSAGRWVEVRLESKEFDPYLIVVPPSGKQIDNDDWEGSRSLSMVRFRNETDGVMRILVTTYRRGEMGAYAIETAYIDPPAGEEDSAGPDSTAEAVGIGEPGEPGEPAGEEFLEDSLWISPDGSFSLVIPDGSAAEANGRGGAVVTGSSGGEIHLEMTREALAPSAVGEIISELSPDMEIIHEWEEDEGAGTPYGIQYFIPGEGLEGRIFFLRSDGGDEGLIARSVFPAGGLVESSQWEGGILSSIRVFGTRSKDTMMMMNIPRRRYFIPAPVTAAGVRGSLASPWTGAGA